MLENYVKANCEVKTMQNELIMIGKVAKVEATKNGERLFISASKQDDFIPTIPVNTKVKVILHKYSEGTKVMVGYSFHSGRDFFSLDQLEVLSGYEKRNFFRVNVRMSTAIFVNGRANALATFRDLSLGGCSFYTEATLEVNDHVEILLPLDGNRYLFGCIVRRVVQEEDKVFYGCSFEGVTEQMSDLLCKQLFQLQKMELKKSRDGVFLSGEN